MNTELEVLKKIYKDSNPSARQKKRGGKTPLKLISNHLGYGRDYIRYICKKLKERNLVKSFSRDWYKITSRGQKELERMGLIKKSWRKRGIKIENPVWERVQIPVARPSKTIKLKPELKAPKTEKLNLGKKIEKVATFLQNFIQ